MLKGKAFWSVFLTTSIIIFIGSIIMITTGNQCANNSPSYCDSLIDGGGVIIETLGGIFLGLDIAGFLIVCVIICSGCCGVDPDDYDNCCA